MNGEEKKRWTLVNVDECTSRELQMLSDFISSFFGSDPNAGRLHTKEYYDWKLNRNPYGKGLISFAMHEGRVVGTTTITPKEVCFKGSIVRSAEIGDTFTDQDFQRQGIFTALVTATRDRAVADGINLIYGTPNNNSLPGYEKNCNFFRKDKLNMFLCIFPLKPFSVIGEKLEKRGIRLPLSVPDKIINLVMRAMLSSDKQCRLVSNTEIPEGLDYLNSCLRNKYSFFVPKFAQYLEYRLSINPEGARYGMLTSQNKNGLDGLLIFKRNLKQDLSTLFVCEVLATSRLIESRLWRRLLGLALDEGHLLVATWTRRNKESMLPMLPFAAIPVSRKELIIYKHDIGIEALRHSCEQWHFSILDSDNI